MSVFNESFNESSSVADIANASATVATDTTADVAATMVTTTTTTTRPIMLVILGSADYEKDAQNFLSWIKGNYQ
jgi:hypothetical protein